MPNASQSPSMPFNPILIKINSCPYLEYEFYDKRTTRISFKENQFSKPANTHQQPQISNHHSHTVTQAVKQSADSNTNLPKSLHQITTHQLIKTNFLRNQFSNRKTAREITVQTKVPFTHSNISHDTNLSKPKPQITKTNSKSINQFISKQIASQ
jgi:hypothetical protein